MLIVERMRHCSRNSYEFPYGNLSVELGWGKAAGGHPPRAASDRMQNFDSLGKHPVSLSVRGKSLGLAKKAFGFFTNCSVADRMAN
jgi:hypothetical protein